MSASFVLAIWFMAAKEQKAQLEMWWKNPKAQRVWIEITRRPDADIGADINNDSTEFLKHLQIAKKGDKVLHWNSRRGHFVGVSTVKNSKPIKIGTNKGLELSNHIPFPEDNLNLEQIRNQWKLVKAIHDKHFIDRKTLYFPFMPYGAPGWKKLRPRLAYLTIAPPELVNLLGAIYQASVKSKSSKKWKSFGISNEKLPTISKTRKKSAR